MSVGEHSKSEEFERVNEERGRLPEDMISYTMEKEKPKEKCLQNRIAMNTMTSSLVDPELIVNHPKTAKSLLMKMNRTLLFCILQMTRSGGRITKTFLKSSSQLYLRYQFVVEKGILKYCSKEIFEWVLFTSELKRN